MVAGIQTNAGLEDNTQTKEINTYIVYKTWFSFDYKNYLESTLLHRLITIMNEEATVALTSDFPVSYLYNFKHVRQFDNK